MHEGRVALVTGAASGIGRATAQIFAREGARVAVVDLNESGAKETVGLIESAGGEALAIRTDVTDEAQVEAMVAETVARYGRLDAAMNNAGVTSPAFLFHEMPLEEWDRVIRINLTGVFLCLKAELAQMVTQDILGAGRGAICNTSSGAGIVPAPQHPHYTASKHGVLGIMKNVALEYAAKRIRCNSVLPGITETPMLAAAFAAGGPEHRANLERSVPGGVIGQPEEVGETAVWLCSDLASRVNGQSVGVDGGLVMR
jgi:NAD(P)-dependent dehydrogenase (short-subunit alcohol dehydrogenase family)